MTNEDTFLLGNFQLRLIHWRFEMCTYNLFENENDDPSQYIYIYIYIYLPTPPLGQDMTQGQF